MRLTSLLLVVALGLVPQSAPAQTTTANVEPGTRIFVTLLDGDTVVAGSLVALSADSVALLASDGPTQVPFSKITRIERRGDGSFDGAVKGASVIGLLCFLNCGQGARSGAHFGQLIATNAAIGAVVGWWVDRRHIGRTTIYPLTPDPRDTPGRR